MHEAAYHPATDSTWRTLYRVGGVAAIVSGVLFRRNLGAEISLFAGHPQPDTVQEWFILLQSHRLLALTYLNVFDLVDYALVAIMLLALCVLLGRVNRSLMAIAATLGLTGIVVAISSNTALSMLALSDQFALSTSDVQRGSLLAAGQALLSINPFGGPGAQPGSGGYMSLLFIAAAGMLVSLVMLRSRHFRRPTAYLGIVAAGLDLAYCAAFAFIPAVDRELLALALIPLAGLLLMVWHLMVGWRLCRL
jgi:hypothetical protein